MTQYYFIMTWQSWFKRAHPLSPVSSVFTFQNLPLLITVYSACLLHRFQHQYYKVQCINIYKCHEISPASPILHPNSYTTTINYVCSSCIVFCFLCFRDAVKTKLKLGSFYRITTSNTFHLYWIRLFFSG